MKTSALGLLTLLAMSAAAYAVPALGDGNGTELFFTGSAGFQYDDNIFFRTNNAAGDYVTTLTPGIDLPFSTQSITKGELTYNEAFAFYSDHSDQNSSLANVKLVTSYDDEQIKAKFDASFVQLAQNSAILRSTGSLVRRDLTSADSSAELRLSEKSSVAVGGAFDRTKYKLPYFISDDVIRVPVSFYYEVSPKVDLSLRYQYRYTDQLKSPADNHDNFLGLGARGEFTAKLSGEFHIGAAKREFKQGGSANLVDIDSTFTYTYSPKTVCQFGVARDFDTVATGSTVRYSSANLGMISNFTETFSGNLSVAYRATDYYGLNRSDKYWEGSAGLSYKFNAHASIAAGYTYRKNSSTSPVAFTDNVYNVVASFRF